MIRVRKKKLQASLSFFSSFGSRKLPFRFILVEIMSEMEDLEEFPKALPDPPRKRAFQEGLHQGPYGFSVPQCPFSSFLFWLGDSAPLKSQRKKATTRNWVATYSKLSAGGPRQASGLTLHVLSLNSKDLGKVVCKLRAQFIRRIVSPHTNWRTACPTCNTWGSHVLSLCRWHR